MTPTSRVPAVWSPAASGPADSQTVSSFTRTELVPVGTVMTKQCNSTSSRVHARGVPSGVSTRKPAMSSTRPCGPCEPGNHFGYHSRSGPDLQGMSSVVWSSFRGSSRASTSTANAGVSALAAEPATRNSPTRAGARRGYADDMGVRINELPPSRHNLAAGNLNLFPVEFRQDEALEALAVGAAVVAQQADGLLLPDEQALDTVGAVMDARSVAAERDIARQLVNLVPEGQRLALPRIQGRAVGLRLHRFGDGEGFV